MKKILYISVNSKCEKESASKTVARMLIDELIKNDNCMGEGKKDDECIGEKMQNHLACAKDGIQKFIINALDDKDEKSNEASYEFDKDSENNINKQEDNKGDQKNTENSNDYEEDKANENNKANRNQDITENIKDGIEKVKENIKDVMTDEEKKHSEENQGNKDHHQPIDGHKTMHSNIEHHIQDHLNDEHNNKEHKEMYHHMTDDKDHNHEKMNEHMTAATECCDSAKVLAHLKAHMDSSNDACDFEKMHEHIRKHIETYGIDETGSEYIIEEVDVYKDYIPVLHHEYFECRNATISQEDSEGLDEDGKKAVARIKELAEQFKSADIYIVAAPMWSLLFPAPLKQYIDCIVLNGTTVSIDQKECKGLLNDKTRKMVFVQSVGGNMPILVKTKLDHSSAYLKDISKFMGISKYEELLVDGTGFTENQKENAIKEAEEEIPYIVKVLKK